MKVKLSILLVLLSVVFFSCKQTLQKKEIKEETKSANTNIESKVETVKILNFEELKPYLDRDDEKTHIVNFWATWCKPCVEELPAFEKIYEENRTRDVEVLLVSLDFPNEIETQLIPFIKNNKLKPEVIVLDDSDQNKWINGIDKSWSGAIPATMIYNKHKRAFFEQSFSYETLHQELQKFIN